MTHAPWNSPRMKALALEVATTVLREKRKVVQARTWPTILITDLIGGRSARHPIMERRLR